MPTGLGAKQFRHIGLGTTRDTSLEERRRLAGNQFRRLGLGISARQGKLDALVGPDGRPKHFPFSSIV